jgi:hypothetical protein
MQILCTICRYYAVYAEAMHIYYNVVILYYRITVPRLRAILNACFVSALAGAVGRHKHEGGDVEGALRW